VTIGRKDPYTGENLGYKALRQRYQDRGVCEHCGDRVATKFLQRPDGGQEYFVCTKCYKMLLKDIPTVKEWNVFDIGKEEENTHDTYIIGTEERDKLIQDKT